MGPLRCSSLQDSTGPWMVENVHRSLDRREKNVAHVPLWLYLEGLLLLLQTSVVFAHTYKASH